MLPGFTSPGAFEMKMWSASVEPIPSRISSPVAAFQRRKRSGGSASPADTHSRSEPRSGATSPEEPATLSPRPAPTRPPAASAWSRAWSSVCSCAAYSVGTPKYAVGRSVSIVSKVVAGVGRRSSRIAVPPTHSGNVIAFPSPYAKKSFAAE